MYENTTDKNCSLTIKICVFLLFTSSHENWNEVSNNISSHSFVFKNKQIFHITHTYSHYKLDFSSWLANKRAFLSLFHLFSFALRWILFLWEIITNLVDWSVLFLHAKLFMDEKSLITILLRENHIKGARCDEGGEDYKK